MTLGPRTSKFIVIAKGDLNPAIQWTAHCTWVIVFGRICRNHGRGLGHPVALKNIENVDDALWII